MDSYVRFSSSPPTNCTNGSNHRRFSFQESPSLDSTDSTCLDSPQQDTLALTNSNSMQGRSRWNSSCSWLTPPPLQQILRRWWAPSPRAYQSNYMTLVPLSGEASSRCSRCGGYFSSNSYLFKRTPPFDVHQPGSDAAAWLCSVADSHRL